MASTNKTPNLGLSQWEQSDAFERKDLNADFLKIDRASEAWGKKTMLDITVSETVQALDLDISGFDMNNYTELEIYMDLARPGTKQITLDDLNSYSRVGSINATENSVKLYGNMSRIALSRKKVFISQNSVCAEYSTEADRLPTVRTIHLKGYDNSPNFDKNDRIIVKGVKK